MLDLLPHHLEFYWNPVQGVLNNQNQPHAEPKVRRLLKIITKKIKNNNFRLSTTSPSCGIFRSSSGSQVEYKGSTASCLNQTSSSFLFHFISLSRYLPSFYVIFSFLSIQYCLFPHFMVLNFFSVILQGRWCQLLRAGHHYSDSRVLCYPPPVQRAPFWQPGIYIYIFYFCIENLYCFAGCGCVRGEA